MCKPLGSSIFEKYLRYQALDFKFSQDDLKKKDYLKYSLVKILNGVRLQNLRLRMGFRKIFSDLPKTDRIHPP